MIFSMRFCTRLQRRIFMPTLAAGGRGGQFLYPKPISAQERKETIVKKTEKEPFDPNKKAEQTKAAGDPAGDAKQDQEKKPEQEDTKPGQDDPEAQGSDPAQEEERPEKEQPEKEEPAQEEEPAPAEPSSTAAENEKLKADLLEARSQIAAYSAGVAPEMVADAVTLATAEANGEGGLRHPSANAGYAAAARDPLERGQRYRAHPVPEAGPVGPQQSQYRICRRTVCRGTWGDLM